MFNKWLIEQAKLDMIKDDLEADQIIVYRKDELLELMNTPVVECIALDYLDWDD